MIFIWIFNKAQSFNISGNQWVESKLLDRNDKFSEFALVGFDHVGVGSSDLLELVLQIADKVIFVFATLWFVRSFYTVLRAFGTKTFSPTHPPHRPAALAEYGGKRKGERREREDLGSLQVRFSILAVAHR